MEMKGTANTTTNQAQLGRAQRSWNDLLDEVLRRGFHGQASIEMTIHDGTISRVARRVERIEK